MSNYRRLDELQERLDPGVFWRVHRSHLVNINKIKEIVPWFNRNYILRMKDEKATEIPVSRTQTRRLLKLSTVEAEALNASPIRRRDAARRRRSPRDVDASTPASARRRCRKSSSPG